MEGNNNLLLLFFSWWYGEAYNRLFKYIRAVYVYLTDLFSVKICLKTLFSVWKRDFTSYDGLSLKERFQVWTMNLASRFIGLIIKSITLFSFLIAIIIATALSLLMIVLWPVYPAVIVYIIFLGIKAVL